MCSHSVLTVITDAIVNEVKNNLGETPVKVILFGSYARGDHDGESDIDIMVLAQISLQDVRLLDTKLTKLSNRLGLEHDVLISVFVKDCETFYKFLPAEPFYQNVLKDGVLLSA